MLSSKLQIKQRPSLSYNVSLRRLPIARNVQVKATLNPLVDVIVVVIAVGVIGDVASTFYRHSKNANDEKENIVKITLMSPFKQNKNETQKEIKDDFDE